jgi:hypothetical protein
MKWLMALWVAFALVAPEANAGRRVRLHCSDGWSSSVTFTLHRSPPELHEELGPIGPITLSCPPDEEFIFPDPLPGDYDGIHGDWDLTDPDGTTTSGSIPPDPRPGEAPPGFWAVWGVHPSSPSSYIFFVNGAVVEDPLAPSFIQPGESLLGTWDEGTNVNLTVRALEVGSRLPLAGASVAVRDANGIIAASGITDVDGSQTLNLAAGESYRIELEGTGYFPQVSDDFLMFADHAWTMLMTTAPPPNLLGDLNLDGVVNGLDVDPFVDVLLNGPFQPEADINDDQVVNGLEFDLFVSAVIGGGTQKIPEPSTHVLALVALIAVGGWRKWKRAA